MNRQILHLKDAISNIVEQINAVLNDLSDEEYRLPSSKLFSASIGQHVRHIIELFIELNKGCETGVVNYEMRKRDRRAETDRLFAASLLTGILDTVEKEDKALLLEAGFNADSSDLIQANTSYYRELAYNIEHAIHHMALIRIGVNELPAVKVNEHFGIASATIKYRKACVQ